MAGDGAGQGPTARGRPSPRRGPARPTGTAPAQQEEHRRQLQALRAQLEGERLRSQELRHRLAAESRELQQAAERERRLLAEQQRCAWEKQRAQEEQRLKEREQRQRAAETRQLLRWKEAELQAAQQLLQQERDAALRQAQELQQQLAQELGRPHGSGREARAKLQDVLSKLRWETDGEQPARIRHLQRELELERRLFIQFIVESAGGEPQGPAVQQGQQNRARTSCTQDRDGARATAPDSEEMERHCSEEAVQEGSRDSCGTEQGSCRQAMKDAHVQVPETGKDDLGLPGSTSSKLLEQHSRLQRALSHLDRQRQALEAQNRLLREGRSPEVCQEVQRLQQAHENLGVLSERLEERCRQLQETIGRLSETPGPVPSQSCTQALRRKAAEQLQAQQPAGTEASSRERALSHRGEAAELQLTEMSTAKARLEEENSRLRGQKDRAEKLQAENADLKAQLKRVAEERNSALQQLSALQAQLQEAELQLTAMREMANRGQQLDRDPQETKAALQKKGDEELHGLQGTRENTAVSEEQGHALAAHRSTCKENLAEDTPGSCLPSEEESLTETGEPAAEQRPFLLPPLAQQPARLRAFLARHSYDPSEGPNEQPELELPLTAGEYVYVFGEMDEDGWFVGQLTDGTRGLVPSNLVEEVSDDHLLTAVPPELRDFLLDSDDEGRSVHSRTSDGEESHDLGEGICPGVLAGELMAEIFPVELSDGEREEEELSSMGTQKSSLGSFYHRLFCLSPILEEAADLEGGAEGLNGQ